ncbi:MAG: hypothetical protein EOP39_16475 [Rubrivivax sp.]|nr:MAG: hypothetical protein EOP39_16475 [Rubrivivax sp.]
MRGCRPIQARRRGADPTQGLRSRWRPARAMRRCRRARAASPRPRLPGPPAVPARPPAGRWCQPSRATTR